jgi:hypothetical protein
MLYSAVGLAVIGVAAGIAFRWKVLLPVIIFLPIAAIVFSVSRGLGYQELAIVVFCAEGILQGGYFLGLLIRFVASAAIRLAGAQSAPTNRRDAATPANDHHTAPSAGTGNGP